MIAVAPGCHHEPEIDFGGDKSAPKVKLVEPQRRGIVRVVGQPSFLESFERTSIYPKPTAYIKKWIVDIGDRVKKSDVLANLYAPELDEELRTKQAAVELDRERIKLAREVVEVDKADVETAKERMQEAEAILEKFESEVGRWHTEVQRLEGQVARVVVNSGVLSESKNQLNSSIAARDKAKATIKRTKAEVVAAEARLGKSQVAVRVAEAALTVAQGEAEYAQAWVGYLTLTAPFSGVISARNANTFDFVLPTTGDPTAFYLSPDISPSGMAAPIYVVDRLDVVRVFIDIPERDANFVAPGTKASVMARAYRDIELPATVTRTSWALNMKSRTLRAEVDLKNTDAQLLPGMYAYVKVIIDHPSVLAVPIEALEYNGNQTFCWLYVDGKSVRAELDLGISDGSWIEVSNRRAPVPAEEPLDNYPWTPIDGSERVILGDLSALREGAPVTVVPESEGAPAKAQGPGTRDAAITSERKQPATSPAKNGEKSP
jgi:multidrug resistance efflux pump